MLYIKNGIFRDSKKFLQCADGRTIFNATPEQWEAEGWKVYIPEPEPVYEKTLEEMKEDLAADARNFMESTLELPISREDRTHLRILAQDLLEEGIEEAKIFEDEDRYVNLKDFIEYTKKLNVVEYQWRETLNEHLHNIKLLETEKEIDRYDYTLGYEKLPELK